MNHTHYAITSDLIFDGTGLKAGITEGMPVVVRGGKIVRKSNLSESGYNYHGCQVYESCGKRMEKIEVDPTHRLIGIYTSSIGVGVELMLIGIRNQQPIMVRL